MTEIRLSREQYDRILRQLHDQWDFTLDYREFFRWLP